MKGNGKRYTGLRARISIQKLHLHLLIWGNKRLVKLAKILIVLHVFHVNQLGRKVKVLHLLSFFNLGVSTKMWLSVYFRCLYLDFSSMVVDLSFLDL